MPYRRKGKKFSRKHRKKRYGKNKAKLSRSRFSAKVPRPLKGFTQLPFKSMVTRTLRICYTQVLVPDYDSVTRRWQGDLAYKCNGIYPPGETTGAIGTMKCPLGLKELAYIYDSYKVNSSKFTCRMNAAPLNADFEDAPTDKPIGPAWIAVRRRGQHPLPADMSKFTLSECRTNGYRFVKVDPAGRRGAGDTSDFFSYSHGQNSSALTTGYKAKYAKKVTTDSAAGDILDPHNSVIRGNPSLLQYYQVFLTQPEQLQNVAGMPVATRDAQPTPVLCTIEILYNVTFWRKKTLQHTPTVTDVSNAAAVGEL